MKTRGKYTFRALRLLVTEKLRKVGVKFRKKQRTFGKNKGNALSGLCGHGAPLTRPRTPLECRPLGADQAKFCCSSGAAHANGGQRQLQVGEGVSESRYLRNSQVPREPQQ